jgi:hypothetical protein
MEKKISVTCECPKSDSITSMTEAFFGLKAGTLSKTPQEKEEGEYGGDSDRTAADYADAEPVETE